MGWLSGRLVLGSRGRGYRPSAGFQTRDWASMALRRANGGIMALLLVCWSEGVILLTIIKCCGVMGSGTISILLGGA